MHHATKIATCCYCGTRAALVLRGKDRHELSCSGCGAPLHEMKALRPVEKRRGDRELVRGPVHRKYVEDVHGPAKRKRPKKRRKSVMKRVFEEAFDVLEDIFD